MKVKKWMHKLLINKPSKSKCKWPSLMYLHLPHSCSKHQVQHLKIRKLSRKLIGKKCCKNRNEIWTQRDNGSWKKKKWGSSNLSMSNKKPKKPLSPLHRLQKLQNKNKWNNNNNKKHLLNIMTLGAVKNPRATVRSILHRKEVRERMMTTLIYPLTAPV